VAKGVEVIFLYNDLDEYVMQNIGSFDGKVMLSVEADQAAQALAELCGGRCVLFGGRFD
jgi:HSP90 family molecular chaperone